MFFTFYCLYSFFRLAINLGNKKCKTDSFVCSACIEFDCKYYIFQVMSLHFIFNLGLSCKQKHQPDGDWQDYVPFMCVS